MKKLAIRLGNIAALLLCGASAWAGVVVGLHPNPVVIGAPGTSYVDVTVSGLHSGGMNILLGAWQLDFTFDPAVFSMVLPASSVGSALGDPSAGESFVAGYFAAAGVFHAEEVSLLEADASTCFFCVGPYLSDLQSDSFVLATFALFAPGPAGFDVGQVVDLGNVVLSDAGGIDISAYTSVETLSATIYIIEPGTLGLVALALPIVGWTQRRRRPGRSGLLVAAAALVVAAGAAQAQMPPAQRDLRFVMSDLSYNCLDAVKQVDATAVLGVDELWIAYANEGCGTPRLADLLARARSKGNLKVVLGLGAPQDLGFWQNQYVDPYVDASLDISPRNGPRGFFLGSQTGQDDDADDVRRAVVGRDAPGLLVNDPYRTFLFTTVVRSASGSTSREARSYRFRFPLLAGANLASVAGSERIATLRISSVTMAGRVYAERPVLASDLVPRGNWHAFDLFVDTATDFDQINIQVDWTGAADLSLGAMRRDHWDPAANRTMLESIDAGIVRTEPTAKFGRNVFDFLDALHAEVSARDPRLFDVLSGFWVLDEPICYGHTAWRHIANQLESYFGTRPGFARSRALTNFSSGDDVDPLGNFYKSNPVDECMKFEVPIYSFDFYMWGLYGAGLPREGTDYQSSGIEWPLQQWRPKATACRTSGIACQNFIDIRGVTRTPSPAEVSLQVYLSLALAFDRVAFWEIMAAWPPSKPADASGLTANGTRVRDLVAELRRIKPTYDRVSWDAAYSTRELNGHYVRSIEDVSGRIGATDLWAEVGEFSKGANRYLLLVNRHTTAADTINFRVSLDIPAGPAWTAMELSGGKVLGKVSSTSSAFTLSLPPGTGRLVGIVSPTTGDFNRDGCVDKSDLALLSTAIASGNPGPAFDVNDDGQVNVADSRRLAQLFTRPLGAAC